jgi:hypothetical protein
LFRDLRRALRLSLPDLAIRLGTRIDVVTALERGEIDRLPPWPETVRVVNGFTSLGRIDPRPVLGIIRAQMERGATVVGDRPRRPLRSLAQAAAQAVGRAANTARTAASLAWHERGAAALSWIATDAAERAVPVGMRHTRSWPSRTGVLVVLVLSLTVATYIVRNTGLEAAFADLRTPMFRLVNRAQDYILRQTAATREGLKWIDVDDPRSRRADRLRSDPR